MYNIKVNDELSINSRLLLNSDTETLEKLFIQHNVDPDSMEQMMKTLYDWFRKEPHLPTGQLHDQLISRLLIMTKYSVEKVKEKIDSYYSIRPKCTEFLSNRDPMDPHINKYLKTGYWIVLPRRTPENHRVMIFRLKSSEGVSALVLTKVLFMIADYRMWNDSVMGEHLIMDYRNVTVQLTLQLTPVLLSKSIYYGIQCLGPKIKGIHLVCMPPFSEALLSLSKKLLKPKIAKRIHIYRSFDQVFRKFPTSIFPKDLGGTDDVSCQEITDAWEETLCSTPWRNFFIQQDSIHSDESKRTVKKHFCDDFGLDGSFKKLNID